MKAFKIICFVCNKNSLIQRPEFLIYSPQKFCELNLDTSTIWIVDFIDGSISVVEFVEMYYMILTLIERNSNSNS